jgi:hypothetical protein
MAERRFRGVVVDSRWDSGLPLNRLAVGNGHVTIHRLLPADVRLEIDPSLRVTEERVRNPLFWRRIVWFRAGGGQPALGFVAFRRRALLAALRHEGIEIAPGGRDDAVG